MFFNFPWVKDGPVVLGPRFKDAFQEPSVYLAIEPFSEKERYVVTYNPSKGKVYALFKDQAKSDDILKAAFHAQVLLYFIQSSYNSQHMYQKEKKDGFLNFEPTAKDLEVCIVESCKMVSTSYGIFKSKAKEQGWMMSEAHLNPGRALISVTIIQTEACREGKNYHSITEVREPFVLLCRSGLCQALPGGTNLNEDGMVQLLSRN